MRSSWWAIERARALWMKAEIMPVLWCEVS